jgi:preprotein translocase subunit SecF
VEFFRDAHIDWLGKKWYFLGFSLIFSVAGVLSLAFWHHLPMGVDFTGGTQVTVHFASAPNEDHIRQAISQAGIRDARIQHISGTSGVTSNDVIISLPQSSAQDSAHDQGRASVENALTTNYHDSTFTVQQVDIVGPTAGHQLVSQARLAVLYSLAGMLI